MLATYLEFARSSLDGCTTADALDILASGLIAGELCANTGGTVAAGTTNPLLPPAAHAEVVGHG